MLRHENLETLIADVALAHQGTEDHQRSHPINSTVRGTPSPKSVTIVERKGTQVRIVR